MKLDTKLIMKIKFKSNNVGFWQNKILTAHRHSYYCFREYVNVSCNRTTKLNDRTIRL